MNYIVIRFARSMSKINLMPTAVVIFADSYFIYNNTISVCRNIKVITRPLYQDF